MRRGLTIAVALIVGLAATGATLVIRVEARPKCPPPCTGNQICSLIACVSVPLDPARDVSVSLAIGAFITMLVLLISRIQAKQPHSVRDG